ncbi:formate-dependent phosphoribosylglycinamide formyltransferase [Thermithiobacillus tepidarius DSM 3134]|uniref:formate-dependent phosphoribosylglycinamide formyltransferase n=1 Tax=Thermithiobacillus tepidarius TaxID=929 RepID=UPI00041C9B8A|nr:formate-dependent phosphoribosylglycinamide formyltransferase [Thermithiobacillus tepidarius]
MHIGTPLSANATRILLLGSGELGKEFVIEAQRLGVEVIAVDRYANAPAMQVAHRSQVLDMTDGAAVKALVRRERPDFVVPEIEAINTDILAEIEAEGLATVIPTARAARLTMNREGIRRLAAEELGLPTSRFRFAESEAELLDAAEALGYPCVVKPIMSSSGKGQSTIRRREDAAAAWAYAASGARVAGQRVIVESFVDFDFEITLLTARTAFGTVFCEPIGHRQEHGDYVESWQPQYMSDAALRTAQEIAQIITDNLGGCGIFGVELFVKGDTVIFSEVSPRPHDTGLVTLASQNMSEFEIHLRAILGLPVMPQVLGPAASAVIYGGGEGWAPCYTGLAEALSVPDSRVRLFGKPYAGPRRRMGVALARGRDVEEARERAVKTASLVGVRLE